MSEKPLAEGYTLVICEKSDAARRISEALAENGVSTMSVSGVPTFAFGRRGEWFVVCAAQGHVYDVSDPFAERSVYPVFDVGWFPHDLVDKKAAWSARRIAAIKSLARNAKRFVNACDYDVEGETIGLNVLKYACGGVEKNALRAKFSALTGGELTEAFEKAQVGAGERLATAGRARHVLDFVWGINLSRMLSQVATLPDHVYKTVSVGRVQGPTLGFVVDREIEIRTFVPRPYWVVRGVFRREGETSGRNDFAAGYVKDRIYRKAEVEELERDCSGKEGLVSLVARTVAGFPPPPPFNTGDLQKEAYRQFGLAPSRTLQVAERLYLAALISYPRTNSQKLPHSLDYRKILRNLGGIKEYSGIVGELLKGDVKPVQGHEQDTAHPAIYPTGVRPKSSMGGMETKLYDLIVRRFLSVLAPMARREVTSVTISVGSQHHFKLIGERTLSEGWMPYYRSYLRVRDVEIPVLKEGDRLKVVAIEHSEKFEGPPPRYNQSSLLGKMELEGLGTKATRAETISTLMARGYVSQDSLVASDLGFAVIEVMRRYAPTVVRTDLTKEVEKRLEKIEGGAESSKDLIRDMIETISNQLVSLNENEKNIGRDLNSAAVATLAMKDVLGACPACKTGKLRIIHSRKTHKRFVGCTNYSNGCRASAPLPQRGAIKNTGSVCRTCSWPMVYVGTGSFRWKLCVNSDCPSRDNARRSRKA